jgi:hypothetical protein
MATPTESYFARLITECRTAFDRGRSGILHWFGLRWRPGGSDEEGVDARLRPHYKMLAARGRVVWGGVAQVNVGMFAAGREDLPGVTVYSPDGYYDAHPHDLAAIGRACFQFKNTVPADAEFRAVADRLTDEFDLTARMPVPRRLADGREVFLGATMFHRARLPGSVLRAGAFPMVIAPELTELNMVLPLAYWPGVLRAAWDTLQSRLERGPITTPAQQVAREVEKRPREHQGPDWDIEAIPIKVTPAMAEACRSMAREMNLDFTPLLFVGFRDDAAKGVAFVRDYDARIEQSFTSNGVTVVVRRDQLERLRGAVVDFKTSAFDTGIAFRLPGE